MRTIRLLGLVGGVLFLLTRGAVLVEAQEPPDISVEVVEVAAGSVNSNPSDPIVWNGRVFFSADDQFECAGNIPGEPTGDELGEYGRELFTAEIGTGPILVDDINTNTSGNCDGVSSLVHEQAAGYAGALLFRARDRAGSSNSTGWEPWRTEGTPETTQVAANIWTGSGHSYPYGMATVLDGSRVAFGATHGLWGTEPWISDGTQGGTHPTGNIAADDYDSDPRSFTPLDSTRFVFAATDDDVLDEELYVSDGSTSTLVADINPAAFVGSSIRFLTTFAGQSRVVFFADDGSSGSEPWVSDGTAGGTFRLADINPGTGSSNTTPEDSHNKVFTQVGDLMFFSATDGATGNELWVTDGTGAGTRLVAEIVPGSSGGFSGQAAEFQGLLFFGAPGIGLWTSDGTELGTGPLVEGVFPSALRELTVVGDLLYFASEEDLWVSDGTVSGTVQVQTFPNGNVPRALTAVGTTMLAFISRTAESGEEIFLAYDASLGPDTTGPAIAIGFAPIPIGVFEDGTLTGTANEANTGGADISLIEFQLDGLDWVPMEAADGAYDSPLETGFEIVSFGTEGLHQACVRATDSLGNLGDTTCIDIQVGAGDSTPPPPPTMSVDPNPVLVDDPATLSVTASDVTTGNSQILIIEYSVDGGNWISILTPVDGFYDEPTEEGEVELSFSTAGVHAVCTRAADVANNVGDPSCVDVQVDAPEPTIRLRGIEVNQVIQSWRNDVPLYRKKPTVVRVFLEKVAPDGPTAARGSLHGSIGGSPLPGSPLPSDGLRFAQLAEDATVADDPETPETNESWRAHLENSLQFTLPDSWIDHAEAVDLEFRVSSPLNSVLACEEPDGSPDCVARVIFENAERPLIEFFAAAYNQNHDFKLEVNATGGTFILSSDGRDSDPIPFDATVEELEDAVEDVLNSRDGRVRVWCDECGCEPARV